VRRRLSGQPGRFQLRERGGGTQGQGHPCRREAPLAPERVEASLHPQSLPSQRPGISD
jgi:hypothetical protein